MKVEVQEKLALMVDEFNKLMDEQRFAEAEVVAKRAARAGAQRAGRAAVDAQRQVRAPLHEHSRTCGRPRSSGVYDALASVDVSAIPFDDSNPYPVPGRQAVGRADQGPPRRPGEGPVRAASEREIEIERKLRTPVSLQFHDAPLAEVMDYLARLAQVNMHLDPQGLAEEGVTSNTPVTIDLSQDISLKSALNLILEPLHLSYVIKDEVLKITSEQLRDGARLHRDLQRGRPGDSDSQLRAQRQHGHGRHAARRHAAGRRRRLRRRRRRRSRRWRLASASGTNASRRDQPGRAGPAERPASAAGAARRPAGIGGPGGLGGGAQADFDSLIELITIHRVAHHLGRSGRSGLDRPVRHEPEPGHQPDAGSPRADRRSARAVAPSARPAGDDRSAVHHAQRQLLRADRHRLRLRHRRRHRHAVPGVRQVDRPTPTERRRHRSIDRDTAGPRPRPERDGRLGSARQLQRRPGHSVPARQLPAGRAAVRRLRSRLPAPRWASPSSATSRRSS